MAHGGRRLGAGRKPGSAWQPANASLRALVRQNVQAVVESGANPIEFLANVVRDEKVPLETRMTAAQIVLPYIAPRQSVAVVAHTSSTQADPQALLASLQARLARLSGPAAPALEGVAETTPEPVGEAA